MQPVTVVVFDGGSVLFAEFNKQLGHLQQLWDWKKIDPIENVSLIKIISSQKVFQSLRL